MTFLLLDYDWSGLMGSLIGLVIVIGLAIFLAHAFFGHLGKNSTSKEICHSRENCTEYPVTISESTGGAYSCQQCIIEDELKRIKTKSG